MDFGSVKNVAKAVTFEGPVEIRSDNNVLPQVFGPGVYLELQTRFYFCFFIYFLLSSNLSAVFPSIVGNPRVALLQPPEEPVQPAGPPALPAASDRKRKKNIIIDLTMSEKLKRKRESKSASNKRQSEKRREEKEREREKLKSLSPGEKEKIARGIIDNEKEWELMNLYNKDNDVNWSTGKKKKIWTEGEGEGEDDWWELNRLPQIIKEMDENKERMRAAAAQR
jgi:hypothetical protein